MNDLTRIGEQGAWEDPDRKALDGIRDMEIVKLGVYELPLAERLRLYAALALAEDNGRRRGRQGGQRGHSR